VTFVFTSLGASPLTGKRAIDQCSVFKRQIKALLPAVEGVSVLVCPEPGYQRREVRVAYERDCEVAIRWVEEAQALGPLVWKSLERRRNVKGLGE